MSPKITRRSFLAGSGTLAAAGAASYFVGKPMLEEAVMAYCRNYAAEHNLFNPEGFYERTGLSEIEKSAAEVSGRGFIGSKHRRNMSSSIDVPDLDFFNKNRSFTIRDYDGRAAYEYEHKAVSRITDNIKWAVMVAEDKRFYEHKGVDMSAGARAYYANLLAGKNVQGASTVTMQLAKMIYDYNYSKGNGERTWERKIAEIAIASEIERRNSKDDILKAYLNIAYFSNGIHGFENASEFYFGKSSGELSSSEVLVLLSAARKPEGYNLLKSEGLEKAIRRAEIISMRENGRKYRSWAGEWSNEVRANVQSQKSRRANREGRYGNPFYDYIRKEFAMRGSKMIPLRHLADLDVDITTTMDSDMQSAAQRAVENAMQRYGKNGAAVVLKVGENGNEIKALASTGIDGDSFQVCNFNMATQAKKQSGSTFKTFLYAYALMNGWSENSTLDGNQTQFWFGKQKWNVNNYSKRGAGEVSLRAALVSSINCATAYLAEKLYESDNKFLTKFASFTQRFGFKNRINPFPSTVLGTSEVTPLELAVAYSVFANKGVLVEPTAIKSVKLPAFDSRMGKNRYETLKVKAKAQERIIDSEISDRITSILIDAVETGTGKRAAVDWTYVAGKTGTTQNKKEGFFVGYLPDGHVILVFGEHIGTGGEGAAPVFKEILNSMYRKVKKTDFDIKEFDESGGESELEQQGNVYMFGDQDGESYGRIEVRERPAHDIDEDVETWREVRKRITTIKLSPEKGG